MSDPKARIRPLRPANDNNAKGSKALPKTLAAVVNFDAPPLPQRVEVEVLAELLDSLPSPANDNWE